MCTWSSFTIVILKTDLQNGVALYSPFFSGHSETDRWRVFSVVPAVFSTMASPANFSEMC